MVTTSIGMNKTFMQPNEKDSHAHRRVFSFSLGFLLEGGFFGSLSIANVFPSCSQSYPIVLKDVPNVTSIVRKATFHPSVKN
jgi:hypothetical protein